MSKLQFRLVILLIFSIGFYPSYIFQAQAENNSESYNLISAQTIVRDSEGRLVTYLETSRIHMVSSNLVQKIINENSTQILNSEIIEINGKIHEKIIFQPKQLTYDTEGTRGINILGVMSYDRILVAAEFQNEGYFLEPDDKLSVIWTATKLMQ